MLDTSTRVASKPWQKGFSLETLKAVAEVFKEYYKPYSYGAFDIPNEAAVATAMAAGCCVGGKSKKATWVAIYQVSNKAKRLVDFAQNIVVCPPNMLFVSDFAYSGDIETALANMLEKITGGFGFGTNEVIALRIHEEDRKLKTAAKEWGFVYTLTQISASSRMMGIYIRQREPTIVGLLNKADARTLSCLTADFITAGEQAEILREISDYNIQWEQHYSSYNKRHSWTAFALRGYIPDNPAFIIKPREMAQKWKKEHPHLLDAKPEDTNAARFFPTTMRVVDRIPGDKDRVRFMRLIPQGELTRHSDITDRAAGVQDGRVSRLHIPITTNPGVMFNAVDARGRPIRMHFDERGLYYLDQRKPHFVQNANAKLERIHLVVDVFSTPALRDMIKASKDGS